MLNIGRTHNLLQRNELGDRGHAAVTHLHKYVLQRLRVETVFGRGGGHDAIDLTKLVEVADVCTTAESTQCVEHLSR